MRHALQTASLLTLLVSATAQAQGTISASLDGEDRTWYSVEGEAADGPFASSVYSDLGAGSRTLLVGGLDDPDPPVETFSRGAGGRAPGSLGDYSGSSLTIAIEVGEGPMDYALDPTSGTQVIYAPDASLMTPEALYVMVEGRLTVDAIETDGESASVRGTFSGRLAPLASDGPGIEVSGGTFQVDDIPSVESLLPG